MHDTRQIFYDERDNFYIDDCGYKIDNIYTVIDPNLIYLFRTKKQDMFLYGIFGEFIELIYESRYDYIYSDNNQKIDRIERRSLTWIERTY